MRTLAGAALATLALIAAGCSSGTPSNPQSWASTGGSASIQTLQADVAKINNDGQNSDYSAMASDCAQLGSDVITTQKLGPIPDTPTQQEWSAALNDLGTGTSGCLTAAQNNPGVSQGVDLTFAYSSLDQARSELTIVAAAVKAQT